MTPIHVIILAAGVSTRLKSRLSKVLHPLCGRPLIDYVLSAAQSLKPQKIAMVVGRGREKIQERYEGSRGMIFAYQSQRLGTAHAVQVGYRALGNPGGNVLILSGDVPLIIPRTLKSLQRHGQKASLSFLSAILPDPTGYGRVVRDSKGRVSGIVEEKNCTPDQKLINEINAGVYLAQGKLLKTHLKKIKKDPRKKEYYLTDLVALVAEAGLEVQGLPLENPQEVMGANTRSELAFLNQVIQNQILGEHLAQGVGMQDPDSIFIDHEVKIGPDTFLGAGVQILGRSRIGSGCRIEPGVILKNVQLGQEVEIKAYSYLEDCTVKEGAVIGPFARIRPESMVGPKAKVGNFVELKKTRLGEGSKANHLSYLGDTQIGKNANIGAGTITCNYDGKKKHNTQIADGVFVGSDSQLVAPVKLGRDSYIASGTTVTRNVPSKSLALSRVPQRNIKGWVKKKKGS
jgi:bifunctional UDP-N-acetylglucosamine pyrophosphorylase/glucosamine-1-phosphate N-acetyltransferase